MSAIIKTEAVFEDSGCYLMARIVGNAAANIVQADINAISLVITKKGNDPGTPSAPVVSTVIFNTLQTDARWTIDAIGYNFRHAVAPADIPTPGVYFFEFVFDPVSGDDFPVVFEVPVMNLYRS